MVKTVMEEGMPKYRNPFEKGNLYIKFDITFPSNNFIAEPKLKVSTAPRASELLAVSLITMTFE